MSSNQQRSTLEIYGFTLSLKLLPSDLSYSIHLSWSFVTSKQPLSDRSGDPLDS